MGYNDIQGTKGWYNKYVMHLKGACRWCWGEKRCWFTLSKSDDAKAVLPPHWVPCIRCSGTGDEPIFNRRAI